MNREPLLFLSHRIPFPPNKGDKIRSFNALKYLSERYRVFLGALVDEPEDHRYAPDVARYCEEVELASLSPRLARVLSMRALLTGEPLSVAYFRSGALADWVRTVCWREGIRRAFVFSSAMGAYTDGLDLDRQVADVVDVDSEKWAQYSVRRRWPLSSIYAREARALLAFEARLVARSTVGLFVSEAEAALFRERAPEVAEQVASMPNGVDTVHFDPGQDFADPFPDGAVPIVFTGAMDYWPNIDAVSWFAESVLPRIRKAVPECVFYIVGARPSTAVRQLASADGVEVTGMVPDVRPYQAYARVAVAPLRVARGIQNKVLEAMAMARPLVVTHDALTGIAAAPGEDLRVSDDAAAMANEVVESIRSCQGRAQQRLRDIVMAEYSWESHLGCLDGYLA